MRKKLITGGAATALLTAGALVAAGAPSSAAPTQQAAPSAGVSAATIKAYPALGRIGTTADLTPGRPVSVAKLAEAEPTLIPSRSRVVDRNTERTIVLVPRTDGHVCLAALSADGAGLNCNLNGGGPVLITYGAAIGVVPTGVSSVTYTLTNGKSTTVETPSGIYRAPAEAASVTYGTGDDQTTVDLMPASTAPDGATPAKL